MAHYPYPICMAGDSHQVSVKTYSLLFHNSTIVVNILAVPTYSWKVLQYIQVSFSLHLCQHLLLFIFLMITLLSGVRWDIDVVFFWWLVILNIFLYGLLAICSGKLLSEMSEPTSVRGLAFGWLSDSVFLPDPDSGIQPQTLPFSLPACLKTNPELSLPS